MTTRDQIRNGHQANLDRHTDPIRALLAAALPAGYKLVITGTGTLAELYTRDNELPDIDGYPTATMGGGHGSDVSRPTQRAALELADPNHDDDGQPRTPQPIIDWVHRCATNAAHNVEQAATAARAVTSWEAEARRMGEKIAGRPADRHPGSGNCHACERPCSGAHNDRLRNGYCDPCRKRWERARRPDRTWFERNTPRYDTEDGGTLDVEDGDTAMTGDA